MSHARDTSFALVGAGGLGGPVAYALAAAGARRLVVIDPDRVDLSNLQRQVQFTTADVGRPKVHALADELVRRGYPRERVVPVEGRFSRAAAALLDGVDVVVDGSDDPETKFASNDEAMARGLGLAIGGVERYGGHVVSSVAGRGGCYRCLFEEPPDDAPSCADAGVLGAAVAAIGGLLARAALGLAGGGGGELVVIDDVGSRSPARRVRYNPRPGCPACAPSARRGDQEPS